MHMFSIVFILPQIGEVMFHDPSLLHVLSLTPLNVYPFWHEYAATVLNPSVSRPTEPPVGEVKVSQVPR